MVRFLCFNSRVHCPKPKKTVHPSAEKMPKTSQDFSQSQASVDSINHNSLNLSLLKVRRNTEIDKQVPGAASFEIVRDSGDMRRKFIIERDFRFERRGHLRKSHSVGSGMFQKDMVSAGNDTKDGIYSGCSFEDPHKHKGLAKPGSSKDGGVSLPDESKRIPTLMSFHLRSGIINNKSSFSIGDPLHTEKEGHENSDTPLSGECPGESGYHTLHIPPLIVKSYSMPNISACKSISGRCSPFRHLALQSRSSEDLQILDMRRREISTHESERHGVQGQVKDDGLDKAKKNTSENSVDDGYDCHNCSGLAKHWMMPVMDEVRPVKNLLGKSSVHLWDELPVKDFQIKRIKEWINDLQLCSPLEETNESSQSGDQVKRDPNNLNSLAAEKVDGKVASGMEGAKNYISSLSTIATTAQLANHGQPFLSAFTSLRVLNLSGNAIGRITAGALPRGLHKLNLSRNTISTIDGLRELTRLRLLDLSHNRIFRIGHGLASCSTLKELYLAGNKISEVEGLHRLLKLNVLDLRFNKISTAKCLGQLAANYSSLQAISLEGNPCQKNVGDEQLKKYLQGLLPYLTCFNRLPFKASTFKDAADWSARLGISSHQLDRSIRSDHKVTRKVSHGLAAHRPPCSSTHGHKSQAVVSPKRSKGRHGLLPPTGGTKVTTRNQYDDFDFSSKLLNFRPDLSIHRSQSEGTLRAL